MEMDNFKLFKELILRVRECFQITKNLIETKQLDNKTYYLIIETLENVIEAQKSVLKNERKSYIIIDIQNIFIHYLDFKQEKEDFDYQLNIIKLILNYLKLVKQTKEEDLLIILISLIYTNLCMNENRLNVLYSKLDAYKTQKALDKKGLSNVFYFPKEIQNNKDEYKKIIEDQIKILKNIKK